MLVARRPLSLLTIPLLLIAQAVTALAQATPATTPAANVDVLAEVRVDDLPRPHAEVWFIRFTLDPGGSLPLGAQLGPTLLYVESGKLTVLAGETAAGERGTPGARPEKAFGAGEPLLFVAGEDVSLRNAGGAPVSFLALLMFTGEAETQAMDEPTPMPEPIGLTQQPLGITRADLAAVPATLTLERLTVPAGGQVTSETRSGGADVGGVEAGSVSIDLVAGQCFVWPQAMIPFSTKATPVDTPGVFTGPQRLFPGDTVNLVAIDGYGCADATTTWHGGAEPATILRARIVPKATTTPMATPAS